MAGARSQTALRSASQRTVTVLLQAQRKPTWFPQQVGGKLPTDPKDVKFRAKGCGTYWVSYA